MTMKILFIGFDDFSQINRPVLTQLSRHFPEWTIDTVLLKPKLRKRRVTLVLAFGSLIRELGWDFLIGRKKWSNWRNHFYSTGYMMRTLSGMASEEAQRENYAFTFQTQSLFRCPPGLYGNFIYTDHTNLNNLNYRYVEPGEYLASPSFHKLERQVYHNATTVFVMSGNIRRSLIEQYGLPPGKTTLVYAGANEKMLAQPTSRSMLPVRRSKNIVFAGKDWIRKGGPLLLKAFKKVLRRIPDATLTVIGCQPKTSIHNCRILGMLPKEKVMEEFSSSAVFCLPTRREPFGMVFIEAMYNHLPVVCTDTGATPEIVEDGRSGFIVPYDANLLAERLCFLLENPEIADEFAENGFQRATKRYTWENTGNRMAEVIRQNIRHINEVSPDLMLNTRHDQQSA